MKLNLTILLLFFCGALFAQNPYRIKGSVTDTASKLKLTGATVCVLNAKDSIIRKFVYTHELGSFDTGGLSAGNFILLISYPAYADYSEKFTLDPARPAKDFDRIDMPLKSRLLHDVIIKGEVNAIKIKGDTTEFNAKAYVIQPNDKVEDLLKQLPGIQVDKDGKITANGQTVTKVLVDGDEFFGDDPTLVTKNLRADMVDKVQLYDKKSDQATFTGIDDGQKTKTINIKLKEDKKNGTFGKLNGGVGTQDLYESQAIYNRFKAKQKYSAYFTSANDGKTGLGFQDNNNLGSGSNNVQFGDDGGVFITGNNDALDSFSGNYFGNGKPLAHSGGLHYDNKWKGDNQSINTNYKIGSIDLKGITDITTQQPVNSNNGLNNTVSNQVYDNYAFRQKADATYQVKFDTTATLKLSTDATFKNFTVDNRILLNTTDQTGAFVNSNNRQVNNKGDQQLLNGSALYTKKFKKAGRTFSWNISEAYNHNDTKGTLISDLKTTIKDTLNQYKTSNTVSSVLNSNMTYSEPLSKFMQVSFNYGFGWNNSTADRKSFNLDNAGAYTVLDAQYSNDYKYVQTLNQVGAIFNYKNKKLNLTFGSKVSDVAYKQVNQANNVAFNRDYINFQPQAMFQYKPNLQRAISFYYNGNTTQPTIDQLQPVKSNSDPLNQVTGNPDLKPSFTHNLSLNYNSSKVLSGSNTYIYANLSLYENAIVNNSTSSGGVYTTKYLNLTDHTPLYYYMYASTNRKLKFLSNISSGISLGTSGNVSYNYINGLLNEAASHSYNASLSLNKYVAKKYSISASAGPTYTFNTSSLTPTSNNNAAGFNTYGFFMYYLPGKFIVGSNMQYNYTAKTQVFDAQYVPIWTSSITKNFFKDENLSVVLTANDMLNKNLRTYRGVNNGIITQTNNSGIGRFIMLSVTWNFTKFATEPTKK